MDVLVRDLLELEEYRFARVLAGEKGLGRAINRIGTIELTDKELTTNLDPKEFVKDGDFYVSTLYPYFEKRDEIKEEINSLIKEHSSGLCILNYPEGLIDEETLKIAENANLPIIAMQKGYTFADIIEPMMKLIISRRTESLANDMFSKIIADNCKKDMVKDYLIAINPKLKHNYKTIYVKSHVKSINNKIYRMEKSDSILIQPFNEGCVVLITAENEKKLSVLINSFISYIKANFVVYIGVSDYFTDLSDFKESLKEACYALEKVLLNKNINIAYYDEIVFDNWLFKSIDNKDLNNYLDCTIEKIKQYEKGHNVGLLKVANSYVNSGGSVKSVSEELYLHENTVRYNINKLKELLNIKNDNIKFLTKLNIIIKHEENRDIYKRYAFK